MFGLLVKGHNLSFFYCFLTFIINRVRIKLEFEGTPIMNLTSSWLVKLTIGGNYEKRRFRLFGK